MPRIYTLIALLTFCGAHVCAQLPIDWTSVATAEPLTNYARDIGTCVCDLTAAACDFNCCCDSECSEAEKAAFKGGCLASTSADGLNGVTDSTPFCSHFLYTVNRAESNGLQATKNVDGSVCVVRINNPITGFFYSDPGVSDANAVFNEQYQSARYAVESFDGDASSVLPSSAYHVGEPIQVRFTNFNSLQGAFSLPAAVGTGDCTNYNAAKFLIPSSSSCARSGNLDTLCNGNTAFDPKYYLAQLRILVDPSSTTTVTPTINQAYFINPTTRVKSLICYDGARNLVACGGGASTDFNAIGNDVNNVLLPATRKSGSVCNHVLAELTYNFVYETSGSSIVVKSVNVDLTYTSYDIPTTLFGIFQQKFTVKFIPFAIVKPLERSGNPGYLVGSSVLLGKLTTNAGSSAILYNSNPGFGLTLPKMLDATTCTSATDRDNRVPITFGEDIVTGCQLSYNYNSITNQCNIIRTQLWATLTGNFDLTHIGKFGNASYMNRWDWVKMINDKVDALQTGTSSAQPGVCSSILTHLDIQFLWADFGSSVNPQPAIIGVRVVYIPGTFKYSCSNNVDCANSGASAQNFFIRASASWIKVPEQKLSQFVPPAPRIIPPIPEDVFYPFKLGASS